MKCYHEPDEEGNSVYFKVLDESENTAGVSDVYGYLYTALTILFLLIHRRQEYVRAVPATHKMIGNKRVAYAAHKTIDLKLFEPKEVISHLAPPTGSHASPRAHEVMGHWVHYGCNPLCSHEWEREVLDEDDPRRRVRENGTEIVRHVCTHCGAKRTFRDHFIRGASSHGWVRHDYVA